MERREQAGKEQDQVRDLLVGPLLPCTVGVESRIKANRLIISELMSHQRKERCGIIPPVPAKQKIPICIVIPYPYCTVRAAACQDSVRGGAGK